MGEVYRAHDAKLNRDVALKVLPESFARDLDRLTRFQREAQVLASLNHPHIAAIYGLEDAGRVTALVMELVDGETLEQKIRHGSTSHQPPVGLPVDEAMSIARQIAEALEAAHELGIVHRDLKPANIKIRSDGMVKVLDFGLAKALSTDADVSGAGLANSPTMASPAMTGAGIILGTAAYMSPEQARGRPVDKRTDIWAFGCVLYEMLTGAATFAGDTTTDVLAAVIQREPDWSRLPSGLPPRIASLLRRCLQRNPKDRLRDIADARFEIDDAIGSSRDRLEAPASRIGARTSGRFAPAFWLAAGAALTATAFLLTFVWRAPPAAVSATVRAIVSLPPDTTLALDRGSAVALSSDGRRLVYAARSKGKTQLYLRQIRTSPAPGRPTASGWRSGGVSPSRISIAIQPTAAMSRNDWRPAPEVRTPIPGRPTGPRWPTSSSIRCPALISGS